MECPRGFLRSDKGNKKALVYTRALDQKIDLRLELDGIFPKAVNVAHAQCVNSAFLFALEASFDTGNGEDVAFAVSVEFIASDFDRCCSAFGLEEDLNPRDMVF